MTKITTSLSARRDQLGRAEILLRYVGSRSRVYRLHSHLFISPDRWRGGQVSVPRLQCPERYQLERIKRDLEQMIARLLAADPTLDGIGLQALIGERPVERGEILPVYDRFVATKDVGELRLKRYAAVRRALERYGRLPLAASHSDLDNFKAWLTIERPRGRNTIIDYLKALRAFYTWAAAEGICRDAFAGYKIGSATYGTPWYLTIDERDRLAAADLPPKLSVHRDIFIWQCLVGCRYGDLCRFTVDNIDGGVLQYVPRKTAEGRPVVVRVPLVPQAVEILERYGGGDRLLPVASNQKYDAAIKECCRLAGLNRKVAVLDPITRREELRPIYEVAGSHLARRTFVGNLYKALKDPDIIASMSGHAPGSTAFARYRDIDDDIRREAILALQKIE